MYPFDYTAVTGVRRWARKPVNHTTSVAAVTPTDSPKSIGNCCLIALLCGVVCFVILPFWDFCWCRGFCNGTESDLFFVSKTNIRRQNLYRRLYLDRWYGSPIEDGGRWTLLHLLLVFRSSFMSWKYQFDFEDFSQQEMIYTTQNSLESLTL